MRDATLVTTPGQLDAAVFRLQGASRLAIDTEFMRERTYYPQLCLVQIATESDCYLVDPLAGLDLGPMHQVLTDRSKLKILHAARQDLEVLLLTGGGVPAPDFDTQVAAGLARLPAAGRLRGTGRAATRALDRQGADPHGLVAPPVDARAARVCRRRRPSPAAAAHGVHRRADRAGSHRVAPRGLRRARGSRALPDGARRCLAPAERVSVDCGRRSKPSRARSLRGASSGRSRPTSRAAGS